MPLVRNIVVIITGIAIIGCGDTDDSANTQEQELNDLAYYGESLYRETTLSGNSFSCASCHSITEDDNNQGADGLTRAGHPLSNATTRPHFKNGQVDDLLGAVNSCLEEWMNAQPLSTDDYNWSALLEFKS
jgi:cytochrome c